MLDNLKVGGITQPAAELPGTASSASTAISRACKERASQRAGSLSGGEQQMLAIGRALMSKPSLLMLDEPSLGLAPVIVERIGEILQEIQASEGLAVLLAEQNAAWALSLANRAVILDLGRISDDRRGRGIARRSGGAKSLSRHLIGAIIGRTAPRS